jgi:heterotetrameric sarcosine oxidase gamma subunit
MSSSSVKGVRPLTLERGFEFAAPWAPLSRFQGTLPLEPGRVQRDGAGRVQLLHFAPRRWLVLAPAEPLYQYLTERDAAGDGALIDVDGKWQWFRLEGPQAARILESSVNVQGLLSKRSCGATTVFDCPAVLARDGDAFDCWVILSYAQTFLEAIGQLPGVSRAD